MPLVKLWNSNRTIRQLIVANDLQNLIQIGREKFGFHSGDNLKVVTESDGNELESEEVFSALVAEKLFPHTVLQLLQETENWTPQQEISTLGPENSDLQRASPISNPSTSMQSFSSSDSESEKVVVPWSLFPKNLLVNCNANKVPSAVQVRQLVRIIVDAIMNVTSKPKRSVLNTVAKQIIGKYPTLGLQQGNDYDHERLFDQLENRVRNVQRPTSKVSLQKKLPGPDEPEGVPVSKKVKKYSHGCAQWQPDAYADGETEILQTEKKEWLREQNKSLIAENEEIRAMMQKTYASQRLTINKALPILDVLDQWPYLFKRDLFLQHANILLGKNITKTWKEELKKKLPKLINFFRSCSKMTLVETLETAIVVNNCKIPEEAGLISMLMNYFEEEESSVIRYFENTSSIDNIKDSLDTPLPIIAVLGNSIFNNENAYLIAEKVVIGDLCPITDIVPVYFATFYVFNIEYPAKASATMEFLQRLIVNINPEGPGNRRGAGCRKRTKVHPKVLTLIGRLQNDESVWNISSEKCL